MEKDLLTNYNKQELFLELIKRYQSFSTNPLPNKIMKKTDKYIYFEDNKEKLRVVSNIKESVDSTEKVIN